MSRTITRVVFDPVGGPSFPKLISALAFQGTVYIYGALKPVIDRAFKFDDMVEVYRYLEKSGQFGKIVVTV